MLRSLSIRDLLIIDSLELEFSAGLNVLTGETGAGKSILLDSLSFVLGLKGRASVVREGAERAEVEAVFEITPDHPATAVMEEAGLEVDDTLILRRVATAEGRKTAWVNDRRVATGTLKQLSETLLEIHGQNDDRGLLKTSGHRAILDDYAEAEALRAATKSHWQKKSAAVAALEAAQEVLAKSRAEEDFLRHAVAELDKLAPQAGEEEALDKKRRLMQAAEKVRGDVGRALSCLQGDGAEGMMAQASRFLEDAAQKTEGALEGAYAALDRASVELGEAISEVEQCLEALVFDVSELELTEERLFALRGLARKHSVEPDALAGFAEELRERLQLLDESGAEIDGLERAVAAAEVAYRGAAEALSEKRAEAATRLDQAVMGELEPLKMGRAVFATQVSPADPGPEGTDAIAFEVATNPGAPSGPLNKIASGGELSRFLLALKVCLVGNMPTQTMIFDEIDRGVGGATAAAVGRRLASLAKGGQVLVVTHSPQVAAAGAYHWRVEKRVEKGQTLSRVVALSEAERKQELARMLAGDTVTQAAEDAAQSLLETMQ